MGTSAASADRARAFLRAVLRASRAWDAEGASYARQEAHAGLRDGPACGEALDRAWRRLEVARHYGIAYERLEHQPMSGGGDVKIVDTAAVDRGRLDAARVPPNPAAAAARARAQARRRAAAEAAKRASGGSG